MGRPTKNNADYFSHDAGMRNDMKTKALRRAYGHIGYSVWNMLLECLTDSNQFEIEYNELNKELLSADFDIEVHLFDDIVNFCVRIELLQLENGLLFSENHKERFEKLQSKRKKWRENKSTPQNEIFKTDLQPVDMVDVDEVKNLLCSDLQWCEIACMQTKTQNVADLFTKICDFQNYLRGQKKEAIKRKEVHGYFINWVNSQKNGRHKIDIQRIAESGSHSNDSL